MIRKKVIGCWRRWCAKGTWFQITCWFGQSASELIVVSGTLCLQKALCGILLWNIFWGVTEVVFMVMMVMVRLLLKTPIKFLNSVQDDGDENVFNENNEGDRRLAILMKMVVTLMMTPMVVLASWLLCLSAVLLPPPPHNPPPITRPPMLYSQSSAGTTLPPICQCTSFHCNFVQKAKEPPSYVPSQQYRTVFCSADQTYCALHYCTQPSARVAHLPIKPSHQYRTHTHTLAKTSHCIAQQLWRTIELPIGWLLPVEKTKMPRVLSSTNIFAIIANTLPLQL